MTPPTGRKSICVTVHGRVQGVGFRYYARSMALHLGICGYVQNLPDGTVKVVSEGQTGAVDAMEEWLKKGPPSARVTHIDSQPCSTAGYPTFTVEF